MLSSTWRAWAEEGLRGEIRWKWAPRQEQARLRPRRAPSPPPCVVRPPRGSAEGIWEVLPSLPLPISLPLSLWPPSGRSLLPPGTCLPTGCSVRFPAQKAGVFSWFLTICCGRYSLECSPLFFFARGTGGPGAGPGQVVASSWCLNWVFTCCWGSPRAPRGLRGPIQTLQGAEVLESRYCRQEEEGKSLRCRCWAPPYPCGGSTPRRQQSITLFSLLSLQTHGTVIFQLTAAGPGPLLWSGPAGKLSLQRRGSQAAWLRVTTVGRDTCKWGQQGGRCWGATAPLYLAVPYDPGLSARTSAGQLHPRSIPRPGSAGDAAPGQRVALGLAPGGLSVAVSWRAPAATSRPPGHRSPASSERCTRVRAGSVGRMRVLASPSP